MSFTPRGLPTPPRRNHTLRIVLITLVCLLASGSALTALAVKQGWLASDPGSPTGISISANAEQETPQVGIRSVAQQYMHAFLSHDYKTMWSLLHPDVQATWPNEKAFTSFWERRFKDYTLQDFSLGSSGSQGSWINPMSMQTYKNVNSIPVSLKLTAKDAAATGQSTSPLLKNPEQVYKDIPLVSQKITKDGGEHWVILAGGPADLNAPVLPPIQPTNHTVQVPILMYHHINNTHPTKVLDASLTIDTQNFEAQLEYLKKHEYHSVTFNQMFNALYYQAPLPKNPIILTFDDGYQDAYDEAMPLLKKHGYGGMFYIISGQAGWTGFMHWEEIRKLQGAGMQIGSHTVHHSDMGQLVRYDPAQAQVELKQSKETIEKWLKTPIDQFCYPSGEPFRNGSEQDKQTVVQMLASDGYLGATTDPGETGTTQSGQSPFALLRVRMDGRDDALGFTGQLPW